MGLRKNKKVTAFFWKISVQILKKFSRESSWSQCSFWSRSLKYKIINLNFVWMPQFEEFFLADLWIKYISGQGQWPKGWWAFQTYGVESQVCRRSKRLFLLSVQRWYPFTFFCFLIFRKRLCSVLGRAQGSNASVEAGRGASPRQRAGGHALQHKHHHQDLSRVWTSCSSISSGVCSEGSPLGTAGGRCH